MTLPDATVVITGDGTGAKAEATVGANGAITAITLTDGGQGYNNAKVDIQSDAGDWCCGRRDDRQEGRCRLGHRDRSGRGLHGPDGVLQRQWWRRGDRLRWRRCRHRHDAGDGYSFPTVDFDLPDDPNGVQAQGHAVCGDPHPDCSRGRDTAYLTVTGVVVDYAGSGYTTAPNVFVRDGTVFDPINPPTGFVEAKAAATLSIGAIVIDNPGANYNSAPTVSINDPTGAGAAATAALDNGVISAITLKRPGAGYITPGGIKKFVDTLPGLTPAGANNLGQYIPMAVPDKTTFANADYYVIARHAASRADELEPPPTLLRSTFSSRRASCPASTSRSSRTTSTARRVRS